MNIEYTDNDEIGRAQSIIVNGQYWGQRSHIENRPGQWLICFSPNLNRGVVWMQWGGMAVYMDESDWDTDFPVFAALVNIADAAEQELLDIARADLYPDVSGGGVPF